MFIRQPEMSFRLESREPDIPGVAKPVIARSRGFRCCVPLFMSSDPNRYSPRRRSTMKLIATYFCDVIANDNKLPSLQRHGFRTHRRSRHCADFRMLHARNAVGRFYHYLEGNRSLWSTSKDVTNRSCNVEPGVPSSRDVYADGD